MKIENREGRNPLLMFRRVVFIYRKKIEEGADSESNAQPGAIRTIAFAPFFVAFAAFRLLGARTEINHIVIKDVIVGIVAHYKRYSYLN